MPFVSPTTATTLMEPVPFPLSGAVPMRAYAEIKRALESISQRYYRLILLVGKPESVEQTKLLQQIEHEYGGRLINVNLHLAEKLLSLTEQERIAQIQQPDILLPEPAGDLLILDHTEILFEPTLHLDPLRLLQQISRNRTVLATWSGAFESDQLYYAEPGHPEYHRYSRPDAVIIHFHH